MVQSWHAPDGPGARAATALGVHASRRQEVGCHGSKLHLHEIMTVSPPCRLIVCFRMGFDVPHYVLRRLLSHLSSHGSFSWISSISWFDRFLFRGAGGTPGRWSRRGRPKRSATRGKWTRSVSLDEPYLTYGRLLSRLGEHGTGRPPAEFGGSLRVQVEVVGETVVTDPIRRHEVSAPSRRTSSST